MTTGTLVDGHKIFEIMDTHGVPLELINERLRTEGIGFNVVEFVECALESKNFTYETIKCRLVTSMVGSDKFKAGFVEQLDKVALLRGWYSVVLDPFGGIYE